MDIGFIGLGKMGFPMARRLIEAKHELVVFDTRKEAVDKLVALGAQAASSPKEVADRAETVMASLPSLQASLDVATGKDGVIEGKKVKRFVDLSTVGSQMAVRIHDPKSRSWKQVGYGYRFVASWKFRKIANCEAVQFW